MERYLVVCSKLGCIMRGASYADLGAAELLAFAHHNRTNSEHKVDVIDTETNPPTPAPLSTGATGASSSKGGADA